MKKQRKKTRPRLSDEFIEHLRNSIASEEHTITSFARLHELPYINVYRIFRGLRCAIAPGPLQDGLKRPRVTHEAKEKVWKMWQQRVPRSEMRKRSGLSDATIFIILNHYKSKKFEEYLKTRKFFVGLTYELIRKRFRLKRPFASKVLEKEKARRLVLKFKETAKKESK